MRKNVGNTVPAVKIGCQAGRFCCLNDGLTLVTRFLEAIPSALWSCKNNGRKILT